MASLDAADAHVKPEHRDDPDIIQPMLLHDDDEDNDNHNNNININNTTTTTTTKPRYKSFRKKYRKMKLRFDGMMEEAQELFLAETTSRDIATKIQEQNDQLMEIILDMSDAHTLPAVLRYSASSPAPHSLPELESDRSEYNDHSLAALRKVTHTFSDLPHLDKLPPELVDVDQTLPPGYFTTQHEEEYLATLDASLAAGVADAPELPPREKIPPERNFAVNCPDSVYNWLRVHQPQVFDVKEERGDGAAGKGPKGGKKEKLVKHEFEGMDDEELEMLGLSGGPGLASAKAGKKSKDDDNAYRPKGGHRPAKRKRDKEDADGKVGKKARKSGGVPVEVEDEV